MSDEPVEHVDMSFTLTPSFRVFGYETVDDPAPALLALVSARDLGLVFAMLSDMRGRPDFDRYPKIVIERMV